MVTCGNWFLSYLLFSQILIEQFIFKLVAIQNDGHEKWGRISGNNLFVLLGDQVFLITSYSVDGSSHIGSNDLSSYQDRSQLQNIMASQLFLHRQNGDLNMLSSHYYEGSGISNATSTVNSYSCIYDDLDDMIQKPWHRMKGPSAPWSSLKVPHPGTSGCQSMVSIRGQAPRGWWHCWVNNDNPK